MLQDKELFKGKAYTLNIYKKKDVALFYKQLYNSNTPKLQYKYDRFVALFGNK